VLTSAGERLFPVIRNGFDGFAAAVASASAKAGQSPLMVTSPNAFASRWLVPRLPKWREEHPKIPLEIIGTDSVLDLRAGNADVGIRYARRMPPIFSHKRFFATRSFLDVVRNCLRNAVDCDRTRRGSFKISAHPFRLDEPRPRSADLGAVAFDCMLY
jgi:DNA-binding transcriptional LysR family regulator